MNTIEHAETREEELNLGLSLFEKIYTKSQAQWSAEQRSLNWDNVQNECERLERAKKYEH